MSESDLDEWELIPDDGSLDVREECEVMLYSPKRFHSYNSVLDTRYFAVSDDYTPLTEEEKASRGGKENPELTHVPDEVSLTSFEKSKENVFVDVKLVDGVDKPPCSQDDAGGLNLWKWSVNGIGAFCSFSVAAAMFCFLVIGNQNGKKNQNQSKSFRIYPNDKSLTRVLPCPKPPYLQ